MKDFKDLWLKEDLSLHKKEAIVSLFQSLPEYGMTQRDLELFLESRFTCYRFSENDIFCGTVLALIKTRAKKSIIEIENLVVNVDYLKEVESEKSISFIVNPAQMVRNISLIKDLNSLYLLKEMESANNEFRKIQKVFFKEDKVSGVADILTNDYQEIIRIYEILKYEIPKFYKKPDKIKIIESHAKRKLLENGFFRDIMTVFKENGVNVNFKCHYLNSENAIIFKYDFKRKNKREANLFKDVFKNFLKEPTSILSATLDSGLMKIKMKDDISESISLAPSKRVIRKH